MEVVSFSQRNGYKPVKTILQIKSIDDDLRTSLWNVIYMFCWDQVNPRLILNSTPNHNIWLLLQKIWLYYFKRPIDEIGDSWGPVYEQIKKHFFSCAWNEVYDFVDCVVNNYSGIYTNNDFRDKCNEVLIREVSGYRFIGNTIAPITSEEEITEIQEALQGQGHLSPIIIHLKTALALFSDRESPDYRNSIKESISAVEAICRIIVGSEATLGKALGEIRRQGKIDLHNSLEDAFEKLYGYTSDEGGIRHSLLEEPNLDFEDAKFMLVSCAAFVNYLKIKASKAGIEIM